MNHIDAIINRIATEFGISQSDWYMIDALKSAWEEGFEEGLMSARHDKVNP